jgi:chromosome condensin MukBEF complex kleisin-like MukF subunit
VDIEKEIRKKIKEELKDLTEKDFNENYEENEFWAKDSFIQSVSREQVERMKKQLMNSQMQKNFLIVKNAIEKSQLTIRIGTIICAMNALIKLILRNKFKFLLIQHFSFPKIYNAHLLFLSCI